MQNKHTPAPWKTTRWGQTISIDSNEIMGIAHINPQGNHNAGIPSEQDEANARLIAAAPELLAALEALQDAFIHVEGNAKGNKAKTEVIKYNDDIREALNAARELRWRIEGK